MRSGSGSESIRGSEGMGTYQCTSQVNTDCAFVFPEPKSKVRAWIHAHPAWVVVGSW